MKLGSGFDDAVEQLRAEFERQLAAAKALQAYGQQVNAQPPSTDVAAARAVSEELHRLAEAISPTIGRTGRPVVMELRNTLQSVGSGILRQAQEFEEAMRIAASEANRKKDRAAAFNELEAAQEAERELLRQGELIPAVVEERVVKARSRWGFFGRRAG